MLRQFMDGGVGGQDTGDGERDWLCARNQLEEEFFQVAFFLLVAEFVERAFGEDVAAVHDRDAVAEAFGLAHDVR